MAKTVTIAGSKFPVDVRPGATITYRDETGDRTGTVWDRAPQGPGQGASVRWPWEGSGLWLWVIPEGERAAVRVRYHASGRLAGRAVIDSGPMVVRDLNGARWVA